MNVYSGRDLYTVAKDFGLPVAILVWTVASYLRQTRRRLSIKQVGTSITDTAIPINDFQTGYRAEFVITNDSPSATIVIAHYHLQLPWNEPDLNPLPDPAFEATSSGSYPVPGWTGIEIGRDYVLNHRRYQLGKLAPGDAFRGFFLAIGSNPIPDDLRALKRKFRHIEAQFLIEDSTGKTYRSRTPVDLYY